MYAPRVSISGALVPPQIIQAVVHSIVEPNSVPNPFDRDWQQAINEGNATSQDWDRCIEAGVCI